MCSVGRDKIINVWDIKEGKSKKTIPVFEVHKTISEYVVCMIMCLQSLEAVVLIPNNTTLAIEAKDNSTMIGTAGEKGKVLCFYMKIVSISCTRMWMIWITGRQGLGS